MGFLATLLGGPILSKIIDLFVGPAEELFKDYFAAKITREQLAEKLQEAMLSTFAQVEHDFQDSLAKTYASFMQTMGQNVLMQKVWAWVALVELFVLVWHQFFIPLICFVWGIKSFPSSGTTVDWAYALIALCLGAPAIASRVGSAATWTSDNLSRIAKR